MSEVVFRDSKLQESIEHFDACQNKRTIQQPVPPFTVATHYAVVCRKNDEPTRRIVDSHLRDHFTRAQFAMEIGCLGCKFYESTALTAEEEKAQQPELSLHPVIETNCQELMSSGHYSEAVRIALATVRDRLRELTGFERAADAFGKGGLYLDGATAEHLDKDFQCGAKYLMMALDNFRNVRSHTAQQIDTTAEQALSYITLCSLAMGFLDNALVLQQSQPS